MKKLTVLCILGLAVLIVANTDSVAVPPENTLSKCTDGKDNDRDGDIDADDTDCGPVLGGGGSEIAYTAAVTTGTFQFAAVDVIPNAKESALIPNPSNAPLNFFRPGVPGTDTFDSPFLGDCINLCPGGVGGDGICNVAEEDANKLACDDWDAVIESCDHLVDTGLDGNDVLSFTVSADDLGFDAAGGGWVSFGGGIDVFDPNPPNELFMGLNFSFIGGCFDGCTDDFVPVPDGDFNPKTKTIPLLTVWVTGHTVARGKKGHCNKDGHRVTLDLPNDLVITAFDPAL